MSSRVILPRQSIGYSTVVSNKITDFIALSDHKLPSRSNFLEVWIDSYGFDRSVEGVVIIIVVWEQTVDNNLLRQSISCFVDLIDWVTDPVVRTRGQILALFVDTYLMDRYLVLWCESSKLADSSKDKSAIRLTRWNSRSIRLPITSMIWILPWSVPRAMNCQNSLKLAIIDLNNLKLFLLWSARPNKWPTLSSK